MGIGYPIYDIDNFVIEQILNKIDNVIKNGWSASEQKNITHRPIRPDEINGALTVATRVYDTTFTGAVYERILGAAADIVVPAGSMMAFFGWIVIEDVAAPLGLDCVARITVNGVVRNEFAAPIANLSSQQVFPTLDQVVTANENDTVVIEAKCPTTGVGSHGIIYPLGYRIGPKSQLNVN